MTLKIINGFNGTLCIEENDTITTCLNNKDVIDYLKQLKKQKENEIKQLTEYIRYFDGQR